MHTSSGVARVIGCSTLRHIAHDMMATPADAATNASEPLMLEATPQLYEKREGRFVCLERHSKIQPVTCSKGFASTQALEAHRRRSRCKSARMPSDRPVSRFHGLDPEAARQVRPESNQTNVSRL
jgi:hypothetical protein